MSDEIKLTLSREWAELIKRWSYNAAFDPDAPKKEKAMAAEMTKYLGAILGVVVVVESAEELPF